MSATASDEAFIVVRIYYQKIIKIALIFSKFISRIHEMLMCIIAKYRYINMALDQRLRIVYGRKLNFLRIVFYKLILHFVIFCSLFLYYLKILLFEVVNYSTVSTHRCF